MLLWPLLSGLHFSGHQADLIETSAMRDVDRLGHPLIFEIRIALDEYDAFGAGLEDLGQTRPEFLLVGIFAVDHHVMILVDHDHDGALVAHAGLLVWRRRLRNQRLED